MYCAPPPALTFERRAGGADDGLHASVPALPAPPRHHAHDPVHGDGQLQLDRPLRAVGARALPRVRRVGAPGRAAARRLGPGGPAPRVRHQVRAANTHPIAATTPVSSRNHALFLTPRPNCSLPQQGPGQPRPSLTLTLQRSPELVYACFVCLSGVYLLTCDFLLRLQQGLGLRRDQP